MCHSLVTSESDRDVEETIVVHAIVTPYKIYSLTDLLAFIKIMAPFNTLKTPYLAK